MAQKPIVNDICLKVSVQPVNFFKKMHRPANYASYLLAVYTQISSMTHAFCSQRNTLCYGSDNVYSKLLEQKEIYIFHDLNCENGYLLFLMG